LRCLNFLEAPSGGHIRVGDIEIDASVPIAKQGPRIRALRQRIGFVFQSFNLFPHRTALENVIEGPVIVKGEAREKAVARAKTLLEKVGLGTKFDVYPSRLSGGQQQRVAIARALAIKPKLMLFDEPTSALDPEMINEVLDVMVGLAQEGMTMMIVTHEMGFARKVATRVAFMDHGRIVEDSPRDLFFDAPRSERARGFLAKIFR
jgi:cystine transport system ATP-binding protein